MTPKSITGTTTPNLLYKPGKVHKVWHAALASISLMAYISGPAGVGNDSTTPNSTTGDTTHAGAFM
jgi:hypothetical protein